MKVKIILSLFIILLFFSLFAIDAYADIIFADDFNDNSRDTSKWDTPGTSGPNSVQEINQRIQYQTGGNYGGCYRSLIAYNLGTDDVFLEFNLPYLESNGNSGLWIATTQFPSNSCGAPTQYAFWAVHSSYLRAARWVDNVLTWIWGASSIPYPADWESQRGLRIVINNTANTIVFQYKKNTGDWVTLGSETYQLPTKTLYINPVMSSNSGGDMLISFDELNVYFNAALTPPTYSSNSTNSTLAGTAIQHDLYWTAGNGLSGYIFSFCNGTYESITSYNWTSSDQEGNTQRFNTTSSTSTTYYTTYYNYSDTTNNKCYWAHETGNPAFPPTWTTGWTTANQCTYTNLVSDNAAYFDVTPGSNDDEDWIRFNFTVNETVANIQWLYFRWNGLNAYDSGEDGDCFVANFGTGAWQKACDMPTSDNNCLVNLTSSISNYIQGNQVAFRCMGSNIDAADPIRSDFMELRVGYSVTSAVPTTETNSSWTSSYSGIDGDDYQNVDKVGAIITINTYNPSASNSTYNNSIRPDIEVGFYNGTAYVNGSYCQINNTMGNNLLNTTAWNCSINKTDAQFLNSWKYQANRSVIIRGIWLDAYNGNIFDEINVTGVYGYVDGWNSTSSSCSDANAVLTNDTWTSMTGTTNWSNVTKVVNSTVGATIKWCVYANDTLNNWNGTSCENPFSYLTVPNYAPTLSNLKEYPTDPATYSPGTTYQFNATVCDDNGISTISTISFEWSTNSSITSYDPINSTCREYYTTKTDLTANPSGYTYKWYANDSQNAGTSVSDSYAINKLAPTLGIAGIVNGTYPFSETVYTTSSNAALTVALVRNDTATPNNTAIIYPAGLWNFTAYTNGNENYSSASTATWNNINRGDILINIWLNGTQNSDKTITYPSDANVTCQINISSQNAFYLYQNGTSKGSQSGQNIEYNADLGAQDYNFTCYYAQTQNYSDYTRTNFLTISKATPAGLNTLLPASTVTYPTQTTVSCSLTTGDSGTELALKRDTVTVSTGTNPSETIILGYKTGGYSYTCEYPSTENYSATILDTDALTINKGSVTASVSPPTQSITYEDTVPQYCSANVTEVQCTLWENNTNITSANDTNVVYGVGVHNFVANTTQTQNYSASNQATSTLTVNKKTITLTLGGITGQTITYETSVTPYCAIATNMIETVPACKLTRDGVDVTSTENNTATIYGYKASVYNFVSNATFSSNYSSSNATGTLTVNKKTPQPYLYVDPTSGTYPVDITAYAYGNPSPEGSQITYKLWRNDTDYSAFNNTAMTQPAGRIVFKSNTSSVSSNYSLNNSGTTINVDITKGSPIATAYLNGSTSDQYMEYGQGLNLTGTVNDASLTVYLDLNATGFGNNYASGTGSKENITSTANLGWTAPKNISYNFTVHSDVNQNYTASSDTLLFYVGDSPPLWQNQGTNDTDNQILQGEAINLTAQGKDSVALDWAWLSTNESGSWKNYTTSSSLNWWNTSWIRRKSITLSNFGSALTNYQVAVNITYDSDMQTDFDDIRFVDSDNTTSLSYWLESKSDSSWAYFWVNVPSIPVGSKTIWVYYGNSSASSTSSGYGMFVFFDDFLLPTSSINTTNWPTRSGTISVSGGVATLSAGAYMGSGSTYTAGYAVRMRNKAGAAANSWAGFTTTVTSTSSIDMTLAWWTAYASFSFDSGNGTSYQIITSGITRETANYHIVEARRNATTLADRFQIDSDAEKTGSYPTNLARYVTFYAYSASILSDWAMVRKYVSPEPTYSTGSEETYSLGYYSSPMDMQDASATWTWSNFTWQNSSVAQGTVVSWKIYYNDTSGNVNVTDALTFTISVPGVCSLATTGNVTYGTSSNVTCYISSGSATCTLYKNSTDVSSTWNNTLMLYPAEAFNFTCNSTSASASTIITIAKATPAFTLTLNGTAGDKTYVYPQVVGVSASESNSVDSDCSYSLLQNGTSVGTGSSISYTYSPPATVLNYTYNTSSCSNFTAGSLTRIATINRADVLATISGVSGTITYGTSATPICYRNFTNENYVYATLWRSSVNVTATENNTAITYGATTYNFVCNTTQTQNYSASNQATSTLTVNQANVQPSLSIIPSTSVTYPTETTASCSVSSINNQVSCLLWRAGVQKTSPETITLGAGNYQYIANTSITQNYTANNTGDTSTLIVGKGTLAGSISGSDVTYPASVSVSPSESNIGDSDIVYRLYRNDAQFSEQTGSAPSSDTTQLGVGTYNYVLNTSSATFSNWSVSSSIATKSVTVNPGTLTLLLDRTYDTVYRNDSYSPYSSVITSTSKAQDASVMRNIVVNFYVGSDSLGSSTSNSTGHSTKTYNPSDTIEPGNYTVTINATNANFTGTATNSSLWIVVKGKLFSTISSPDDPIMVLIDIIKGWFGE